MCVAYSLLFSIDRRINVTTACIAVSVVKSNIYSMTQDTVYIYIYIGGVSYSNEMTSPKLKPKVYLSIESLTKLVKCLGIRF